MLNKIRWTRSKLVEQIRNELRTSEVKEERFKQRIEYLLDLIPYKRIVLFYTSNSEEDNYEQEKEKILHLYDHYTLLDKFIIINRHGEVDTVEVYKIKTRILIVLIDSYGIESFYLFRC